MSFFFEEDKSLNTLLEPQENFYTKKELPPEQPKLGGVEARAKGREEYFTAKSFLDNFNASIKDFETRSSEVSEYRNLTEAWGEITDIMLKKNINFYNPMPDVDLYTTEFGLPSDYKSREDRVIDALKILEEEQNKNQDLKRELESKSLNNLDAILKKISVNAKDSEAYANELYQNTNFSGKIGNFAGTAVGYLKEPSVLVSLPAGFAYGFGTTALQTFLKTAYYETVLGAGAEASRQLNVQPYRKKLGYEGAGFEEGAKEVFWSALLAGGIGGVLNTGVYGISKLFSKTTPDMQVKMISKIQNNIENLTDEQVLKIYKENFPEQFKTKDTDAAAQFVEDRIFENKQNPMVDNVRSRDLHNERTAEVTANLLNDEPILIPDELPQKLKFEDILKGGSIEEFDINKLSTDAKTFQYKSETNEFGISQKLMEVTKWDQPSSSSILVYEFKDGRLAVVDGHQRFGLAKKLIDQKPKLYGYRIREVDGYSPDHAMLQGVAINLRHGTGTAIDAAKMMRVKNFDINAIMASMPIKTEIVKVAQGLTKLSNESFSMVVNKFIDYKIASRVGELLPDKELHVSALSILKKQRIDNMQQVDLILKQIRETPSVKMKEQTLFGVEEFKQSLIVEKAALLSQFTKSTKDKKKLFSLVLREDELLTSVGNKLDNINNEKILTQNAKIQEKIEILATRVGQLSTDLTEAAKLYQAGRKAEARKYFANAVDRAAERGDFDGINASGSPDNNAIKTEIQTGTPGSRPKSENLSNKLFDQPGGKGSVDQSQSLKNEILVGEEVPPAKPTQTDLTNSINAKNKVLDEKELRIVKNIDEKLSSGNPTIENVEDIRNSDVLKKIIKDQDVYYEQYRTDVSPNFVNGKFTDEYLNNKIYKLGKKEYKGIDNIINAIYQTGSETKDRIAFIVTGLPAAGKSTFTNDIKTIVKSIVIDPDDFKKVIPEYKKGIGTSATHKESKVFFRKMGEKAIGNGDNIILPILGRNEQSLNEIIQSLKENKYNIIVTRVDVPINVAKLRNLKRAIETGRYVYDDIISKDVDNVIKTNYNKLTKEQINVRSEIDGTTTEGIVKYISGSREEIEANIRGWREIRARDVEGNAPKPIEETKPIIALGDEIANILDQEFSLSTKLDDVNEIVPELKTMRQILDEENQTNLFIERLKDCI
jgi:adenylate kinase family enzyme